MPKVKMSVTEKFIQTDEDIYKYYLIDIRVCVNNKIRQAIYTCMPQISIEELRCAVMEQIYKLLERW